jgi:predicted transcriptional regulator
VIAYFQMNGRANSIQLPAALARQVHRAAKRENRSPSDLASEALQWYLRVSNLPEEKPTPADLRAIRRGRKAFQRGDYITLGELQRAKALYRRRRRSCPKVT